VAKEKFDRSKPHVNVARLQLIQAGLSFAGIEQLLGGQPILNPDDRDLVAEIVIWAMNEGGITAYTRKVIGTT
jgi:hypothetical protein